MSTIYFYEPHDPFGFLSNFYPAPLIIDGQTWLCSEHYYHAQKFESQDIRRIIQKAPTPDDAFRLSRQYAEAVREEWMDVRVEVMRFVVMKKFEQHAELRKQLLATENQILAECSPCDAFWGVNGEGLGENKLGQILMDVRAKLATSQRVLSL
ncbi:NADAR family protein [Enterovibrio baiacu]|uniref:NADAR family protein n=1 Tax=Enterovibrio baiacu TaxID=2491023 RepID=UPI003D1163A3